MQIEKQYILSHKLLIIFLIFSTSISAQLTYIEFDAVGVYTNFRQTDNTSTNGGIISVQIKPTISVISRTHRFIGFGVSLGIPVYQEFEWNFSGKEVLSDGRYYDDDENSFSPNVDFIPEKYNYNIHFNKSLSFFAKIYFKPGYPINIDLRYTHTNVDETFEFERSGKYFRSINFINNVKANGPGFSISSINGSKRFNLIYKYNFDYLQYHNEAPFSYNIAYKDENSSLFIDDLTYVTLESKIKNRKYILNEFIIGISYKF